MNNYQGESIVCPHCGGIGRGESCPDRPSDFAPVVEPPATSPAQPPKEDVDQWMVRQIREQEDARKLRIMKAMEERSHPDAKFTYQNGVWTECSRAGQPEIADPEEQRIDKEIAEVKESGAKLMFRNGGEWVYCPVSEAQLRRFLEIIAEPQPQNETFTRGGIRYEVREGSIELMPGFKMKQILPILEPEAEKLWEGELWTHATGRKTEVLVNNIGDAAYMEKYGWRRIKVREVRGE